MLGNLARATYVGSSDYMWPYSYSECDPEKRMSQEINGCSKINHYGMEAQLGRGAPEIDLIEASESEHPRAAISKSNCKNERLRKKREAES